MNNKTAWEDVKKQWTWKYLTSEDYKTFLKTAILPPVVTMLVLIGLSLAAFVICLP